MPKLDGLKLAQMVLPQLWSSPWTAGQTYAGLMALSAVSVVTLLWLAACSWLRRLKAGQATTAERLLLHGVGIQCWKGTSISIAQIPPSLGGGWAKASCLLS